MDEENGVPVTLRQIEAGVYSIVPPRDELIWAAVDLDGTLAEPCWPHPGIGAPIQAGWIKVQRLVDAGYKIVIHTARGWEDYELIESWLRHWGIPFSRIVCGKVLAAVYVDDKAVNASADSWLPVQDLEASNV